MKTASLYPISLKIEGEKCLVVGGGKVALRKIKSLLEAGARVVVVSPSFCPELLNLEGIERHLRPFQEEDLEGSLLVIGATDDREVQKLVSQKARKRGLFVNIVDEPSLCNFFVPSNIKRGPLCISISTAGASPALAKAIREELEQSFGQEYGPFVELLGKYRPTILKEVADEKRREALFSSLVRGPLLALVRTHGVDKAEEAIKKSIEEEKKRT